MKINISVHDVTPKFQREFEEIFCELDKRAIGPRSILVIPNYELKYDISKDDNFLSWISKFDSDEIVQHGYEHVSHNRKYLSPMKWFWGEIFCQGCGEFQNIGYKEARQRIKLGKKILASCGMKPKGFIAPA